MLQVKIPYQDYECNQCNGKAVIPMPDRKNAASAFEMCPKCFGTTKIDWVTHMKPDQPSIFNPADKDPYKMAEAFKKLQEMAEKTNTPIMTITER